MIRHTTDFPMETTEARRQSSGIFKCWMTVTAKLDLNTQWISLKVKTKYIIIQMEVERFNCQQSYTKRNIKEIMIQDESMTTCKGKRSSSSSIILWSLKYM